MTADDRLRTPSRTRAGVGSGDAARSVLVAPVQAAGVVACVLLCPDVAEGALLPATARGNGTLAGGGWVRRARGPGLSEEAAPVLRPCLRDAGGPW